MCRLWILSRLDELEGFNEVVTIVVRATTEEDARRLVTTPVRRHRRRDWHWYGTEGPPPWLDPAKTSCTELTGAGEPGVIIRSE